MDVVVAGGHGKIGRRLLALLAKQGHSGRGVIRNPDHAADLEAIGATAIVFDLETETGLADRIRGADAVVFAAGAGPGSGPERKRTVDLGGALKLIEACREAGVARYVMVSSINADQPDNWSEEMRPYLEAKREADEALVASGLDYTIVRPGGLTDDAGTGRVKVGTPLDEFGSIPRDDVAATLLAALEIPVTSGLTFDEISGETPIAEAIASLTRGAG